MFFRTKRQYFSLRDVPISGYTFYVDHGTKRFFINFDDLNEFEDWYEKVPYHQRILNEVITSNKRKFILDLDISDSEDMDILFMYDFERHISNKIKEIFDVLNIGIPNVIVYNMSDDNKISFHFVVSNFVFSASTCLGLSTILSKHNLWGKYIDTAVYKNIQFIRIEDSTKFQQKRWKIRSESCLGLFKDGLLSCFDNTIESDFSCNIIYNRSHTHIYNNSPNNIKDQFKLRKQINDTLFLQRVKSGYCQQCKRVHNKENAIIKYANTFICWRYYYKNSNMQ